MKTDYLRRFAFVEVTFDGFANIASQIIQRVAFSEYGCIDTLSGKTTFVGLFDQEKYLAHVSRPPDLTISLVYDPLTLLSSRVESKA
jgi:hypothetical protein